MDEAREGGGVADMVMVVRRGIVWASGDIREGWKSKPRNGSLIYVEFGGRIGSLWTESLESIDENVCTAAVELLQHAKVEVLNIGFQKGISVICVPIVVPYSTAGAKTCRKMIPTRVDHAHQVVLRYTAEVWHHDGLTRRHWVKVDALKE